jgi:hypothetical protein
MISLISTMKDGRVIYLPDDDQSGKPDLTPETVEPEPSSGEATNPINLTDELMKRIKTAHQFQRVIAILRKYVPGSGTIHDKI